MITCPTCGRPVQEGQRFCSNCGTDVQAAHTYHTPPSEPPPPPTATSSMSTGNLYNYEQGAYEYAPVGENQPSTTVMLLIIAGVAVLCLCCGIVLGAAGWYWLGPVPTPVPAPPPSGLLLWFQV